MFEGLFQPTHLILVLVVALLVFGPGKLPELGKTLGESLRELRKALNEATPSPKPPPKRDEPTEQQKAQEPDRQA